VLALFAVCSELSCCATRLLQDYGSVVVTVLRNCWGHVCVHVAKPIFSRCHVGLEVVELDSYKQEVGSHVKDIIIKSERSKYIYIV
jgi:hypothetical protein